MGADRLAHSGVPGECPCGFARLHAGHKLPAFRPLAAFAAPGGVGRMGVVGCNFAPGNLRTAADRLAASLSCLLK